MEVTLHIDRADWERFQSFLVASLHKGRPFRIDSSSVAILIAVLATAFLVYVVDAHLQTLVAVTGLFLFGIVVYFWEQAKLRERLQPLDDGWMLGQRRFRFSDDGMIVVSPNSEAFISWNAVRKIERAPGAIYIFVDSVAAFILPDDKVANAEKLYQHITDRYSAASKREPPAPSP